MSDDEFYLEAAARVATMSVCERRAVGAVLVSVDHAIAGVGWNRSPEGYPGCDACPRRLSGCSSGAVGPTSYDRGPTACWAIHAEAVAILGTHHKDRTAATLYVTVKPCLSCELLAREAGIAQIVYPGGVI